MSRAREIAKFACGFEAFHALAHGTLALSGTTLTVFGLNMSPTWHGVSAVINAIIAVLLGIYAWRWPRAAGRDLRNEGAK